MNLDVIHGNTEAVGAHKAKIVRGMGIPLFSRKGEALRRIGVVLGKTVAVLVHDAKVLLGIGIPIFGKRCPYLTHDDCAFTTTTYYRISKKNGQLIHEEKSN